MANLVNTLHPTMKSTSDVMLQSSMVASRVLTSVVVHTSFQKTWMGYVVNNVNEFHSTVTNTANGMLRWSTNVLFVRLVHKFVQHASLKATYNPVGVKFSAKDIVGIMQLCMAFARLSVTESRLGFQ